MEEMEVPTEKLHETIEEEVEEAIEKKEKKGGMAIAISTALMAVFAAMASLLAGHHADEAVIEQIRASDKWAFFQAKGIKDEIYLSRIVRIKRPAAQNINPIRQRSKRKRRNQRMLPMRISNTIRFLQGPLPYSRFQLPFRPLRSLQKKDCSGL